MKLYCAFALLVFAVCGFAVRSQALESEESAEKRVLFLCTGNFYRSRMAQAVFNYEMDKAGLKWRAFSRGLQTSLLSAEERKKNVSPLVLEMLDLLGIPHSYVQGEPTSVEAVDFVNSDCVVALSRTEHAPYLKNHEAHLPSERTIYWDIEDVQFVSSKLALPLLVHKVRELVEQIKRGDVPSACK